MNRVGQVKIVGGGLVAFVLRLPAGQVEFCQQSGDKWQPKVCFL